MAKPDKITVEVNPDELGVLAKHDYLMANDQKYRDEALTPPGGYAPGEHGKEPSPTPDDQHGLSAAALVAAAS